MRLPDIGEYQVRQTARGADVAVRATAAVPLDGVRADLVAALRQVGLAEPLVTVTAVDHLSRKADTGKLTCFVPLAG